MKIQSLHAREIIDSRGNPTLEAELTLSNGGFGRAAVPSGASTGSREALELRDGDNTRYLGKGVLKAVSNVKELIAPALIGKNAEDIGAIDQIMRDLDGTEYKSKLGANATLGVSMAACRAVAQAKKIPLHAFLSDWYYSDFAAEFKSEKSGTTLPLPMMNILNGGKHADNNLSIQEFMILPAVGRHFSDSLRAGCEIFHHLKKVLHENKHSTNVGDEGGFAPNLQSNQEALDLIVEAIGRAGYRVGQDVFLALDAAASEFALADGGYEMLGAPRPAMSSTQLVDYYAELALKYPLVSIEDGLAENDWDGWAALTKSIGRKIMLVGDDLFVTNEKILQKGISGHVANSILIKLNQIGTVSETMRTMALARKNNYSAVVSHRSGETDDTFLAELCVATDAGLLKTGSASRGERMSKYNELLRIEERLGTKAHYYGLQSLGKKL